MDHKIRLKELADFLQPYQRIWQNEIMLCWPKPFDDYPMEWVEELAQVTDKADLIRLEMKDISGFNFSQSLQEFYQRIEELSMADGRAPSKAIPEGPHTFLYMIPKKEHEIRRLAPFIHDHFQERKLKHIVDIGGGIGLLAQTLANQYDLPITSLDLDPVLQTTGRDRHLINSFIPKNKVNYENIRVHKSELAFRKLLDQETFTIGLHTCGVLANDHIQASAEAKIKSLLNFGCCYNKLEKHPEAQNLSTYAQSLPNRPIMGNFALTLSARAHRKMDEKDFDFKLKVKNFRYAIHFLLHDEYGRQGLDPLGNSHKNLYLGNFSVYASEQFRRLGIEPKHSLAQFDDYFQNDQLQKTLQRIMSATLLRNALGRPLELYLLRDRAQFLVERGYQTELLEFFDETISPRNLGLMACS